MNVQRFLVVAVYVLLAACTSRSASIHPEFVTTFIDVNRHGDDDAAGVAFDPTNQVLAVGRESGRLELWDARKPNARILVEAHSIRTGNIAFGSADGIVFTNSGFEDHTKVWDVHTGKLLHDIKGARGPTTASPTAGVYIVAHDSGLALYQHARRALIGEPLDVSGGGVTAVAADPVSGLVAVGTAGGSLHLLKLEKTGTSLKLSPLRKIQPYEEGNWIQAVTLVGNGGRLVSVTRLGGEVAEWDTATLQKRRVLPSTLREVYWASSVPNEPWLILSGTMGPDGAERGGKVELVDLHQGVAWRYKANTTHPVAVLLPEIATGLILQNGAVRRIRYLDQ